MSNELNELLNNYEKVIYGKEEISKPTIHQIHLLLDYIANLQQENQELKKQLEELDKKLFFTKNELDMRQKSIDNKLNQQKEFIEYLEKTIVDSKAGSGQQYYTKEHLSKYKEIIGVSNE